MLTQTSIHVIRAFVFMAVQPGGVYVGASAVAREIDAPQNYLGKVLQQFVQAGLLDSQRGANGGLRLRAGGMDLTLFDIVEPIEHLTRQPSCFMGKLCCGPMPCRHHAAWARLHEDYVKFLKNLTIGDLVFQNSINPGHFVMPGSNREVIYADIA